MNSSEVEASSPAKPADARISPPAGQTPAYQRRPPSPGCADGDLRETRLERHSLELHQLWGASLQPEFQDSNLSPALPLLPTNHRGEPQFTEYSLFQQSGNEFVPLRPYPDISMASEKFNFARQNCTSQTSGHGLLSLLEAPLLPEGESSCCSLSQHSFSPINEGRPKTTSHSSLFITADRKEDKTELVTDPQNHPEVEAAEDEAFFLDKDVPAQHLLKLLQKDFGMLTDSSSTVSSASLTSGNIIPSVSEQHKSSQTHKQAITQTEAPHETPCEAHLSQQHEQQSDRDSYCEQSLTWTSEASNITVGPRSTRPDHSSDMLHRQLLKETEREEQPLPAGQPPATPHPTGLSQGKLTDPKRVPHKGSWTGAFSAGVYRSHNEQHLCSLGNQTDIEGSYLGFLPQSQSTPGIFKAPSNSSVKAKAQQLSAIESSKDNYSQSDAAISPQSPDHKVESDQEQEKVASAQVPSLPSVSYMQKVDAWRANQTSGKTSLLDSLALQGFSGISPKKSAYNAISDTLNQLLSERVRCLQQPLVSVPANQSVPESSSVVPPGSSLKRGREEVVSSIPADNDATGSSKGPSGLLPTASQSHLDRKDQGTKGRSESEKRRTPDDDPSTTAHLSALLCLGRFSDGSADHHLTLSNSQDSNGSGIKLGTSIGTSSVVSLEVDNYAPYWTSKPSTPLPQPPAQELNIEERIPLYLHNLGIDQSPSTILTPFVSRGPIREPEFSPTDLCTIKGSIGTPTKSTQPSEGGSPSKGEFSGCGVMPVDLSISIPFSLDSLGLGVSIPEQIMQPSTSDTEDMHNHLPSSPQPDEDSYPSTLQTTLQQPRDGSLTSSQSTIQLGDGFDSDVSLSTEGRHSESSLRTSRKGFPDASSVGSELLLEVRNLLAQAESMFSAGSCAASSLTSHILSNENILLPARGKNTELLESSLSSSATVDPRSQSSQLWVRSSSDSMLTSSPLASNPSATTSCRGQKKGTVDKGAVSSFVLPQSVHRTEPEGCSAAPPDSTIPPQPAPTASSGSGLQQLPPAVDTEEEEEEAAVEDPEQNDPPPLLKQDTDQGALSDGSSGSSLAAKVSELLQTESPTSVMSSTSSTTDQERRARVWIKLKVSGQHCEPLELHEEDRRRIEEIKKELLMRFPMKSQESTDTESTSSSSFRLLRKLDPDPRAETCTSRNAVTKQTQTLQSHSADLFSQLQNLSYPDLEGQIREIAAREGVTLTRTTQRAFTSITVASHQRSSSPSSSASPELLHLSDLSTHTVDGYSAAKLPPPTEEHGETTEPAPAFEPGSPLYQSNQSQTSQLQPGNLTRQEAIGGYLEEADLPSEDSSGQQDAHTQSVGPDEESPVQYSSSVSAHGAKEEAVPSTPESAAPSSHVSHVHLHLSPRTTIHSLSPLISSPHIDSDPTPAPKELLPVRPRSSASSPDEGVGLSSPPEWCRNTEMVGQQDPCMQYRTSERAVVSPSPQTTEAAVLPVLLPYKPSGSEELFYIPQTEANFSSDTTMESSHPGSDDAVPPRFSSDILGYGDPGIGRGVTTRHAEGIYSRRLETSSYQMQEAELRESTSQTTGRRSLQPSSPVTRATVMRDQGTSPVHFLSYNQSEFSHEMFQPIYEEVDREKSRHHSVTSTVPPLKDQAPPPPQSSSTLDQLWEKFCSRWQLEDSKPTGDREASLLERLERLSRLIHNTRGRKAPGTSRGSEDGAQRKDGKKDEAVETQWRVREGRTEAQPSPSGQAQWVEEPSEPADASVHGAPRHQHLCPADWDETDTVSTSGSISTVDTARLVRVFGSHRVQLLKTSSNLRKLYSTIDRQKERQEQRGGRSEEHLSIITEDSTVTAESTTSSNAYSPPSPWRHGPSRTLTAKKTVEVATKGVQADDLELLCDGTRQHTRDVGTTFPSPAESRLSRQISSSSSSLGGARGRCGKPPKTQKRRKTKKSPSKVYSGGVSWFIPAEELRAEGRKENFQEEEGTWRPSTSWFELYSRIQPWREPLRQRQTPEDTNKPSLSRHLGPERILKPPSSAPAGLSLQEALAARRPEFISQSRQRLKRLALQVEERKLQEVLSRRREEHLSRPGGAAGRLKLAGTRRRAVPRKEMIQRSKQIYDNLPEVRKRREEERRRAQYDSYRLNARLYNKRVTSRVLGRTAAWC